MFVCAETVIGGTIACVSINGWDEKTATSLLPPEEDYQAFLESLATIKTSSPVADATATRARAASPTPSDPLAYKDAFAFCPPAGFGDIDETPFLSSHPNLVDTIVDLLGSEVQENGERTVIAVLAEENDAALVTLKDRFAYVADVDAWYDESENIHAIVDVVQTADKTPVFVYYSRNVSMVESLCGETNVTGYDVSIDCSVRSDDMLAGALPSNETYRAFLLSLESLEPLGD